MKKLFVILILAMMLYGCASAKEGLCNYLCADESETAETNE